MDIYIPEIKTAIEFNGLYWHSEEMRRDKITHFEKKKLFSQHGIHLIHVYENEWQHHKDVVKTHLEDCLRIGAGNGASLYGSYFKNLSEKEGKKVFESNSLIPDIKRDAFIALIKDDRILAIAPYIKQEKEIKVVDIVRNKEYPFCEYMFEFIKFFQNSERSFKIILSNDWTKYLYLVNRDIKDYKWIKPEKNYVVGTKLTREVKDKSKTIYKSGYLAYTII